MDCSVCQHPGKPEIERLLASGAPLRKVAAQFNLGRMALLRHKQNHMACHGSTVTNDRDTVTTLTFTAMPKARVYPSGIVTLSGSGGMPTVTIPRASEVGLLKRKSWFPYSKNILSWRR